MSGAALRMAGSVDLLRVSLSLKPVRTNSRRSHVAAAAKLPYGQGDTSPRKSLQTQATNSAVNLAAMVESDLMLSPVPSMDTDMEEFQFLESMQLQLEKTFNNSQADADQTLEDMDALLLGLEGLDAELESALEVVREDFSEMTLEDTDRLEAERARQMAKMKAKAPRVKSSKPQREVRSSVRAPRARKPRTSGTREPRVVKTPRQQSAAALAAASAIDVELAAETSTAAAELQTLSLDASDAQQRSLSGADASSSVDGNAPVASGRSTNRFASSRSARLRNVGGTRVLGSMVASAVSNKAEKLDAAGEAELAQRDPEAFLRSISCNQLLSLEQERQLATLVQARVELEETAKRHATAAGRLPSEAEWAALTGLTPVELRRKLWLGQQAREHMIACNMRLVVSIAKRYVGRGMPLQDLVAEGVHGLKRGVEKFDPSKGFKFSTYAHWWIRQAVTRSISDYGRVVRLPVHLHELLARVRRVEEEMEEELGRSPETAEVAKAAGLTLSKLTALYKVFRSPTSYETPHSNDADDDRNQTDEYIEDQSIDDPSVDAARRMLQMDLENVLNTFSPREANIIRMRYGLVDGKESTLEEVGQLQNLTRERIRQLESKILSKMRTPSRISHLSSRY